jgi:hypothetical protein
MAVPVPFTGNMQDLSNYNGFQWAFHCNRCGNGFRSPYEQNVVSGGQEMLRMAGRFFGGPVETVSESVDEFNAYSGGGASQSGMKERAFSRAVAQVQSNFQQCRGCGQWRCARFCWNEDVGQCQNCSPLVSEEIARAQAAAQRSQIQQKAAQQDWTRGSDVSQRARLRCTVCGSHTSGGKFCQNRGRPLRAQVRCMRCGAFPSEGAIYCDN